MNIILALTFTVQFCTRNDVLWLKPAVQQPKSCSAVVELHIADREAETVDAHWSIHAPFDVEQKSTGPSDWIAHPPIKI